MNGNSGSVRTALPPAGALAWTLPLVATLSPVIQISPARSTSVLARTMPLLLTSDAAICCAEWAVSLTVPPSATMLPLLPTLPETLPGVTTAEIRPWPLMLTVAVAEQGQATRVRASTLFFDQAIGRFFSTLPPAGEAA